MAVEHGNSVTRCGGNPGYGAMQRSWVQEDLAGLRNQAQQAIQIAESQPEEGLQQAVNSWRSVQAISPRTINIILGLEPEVRQTAFETQRSLFQILSSRLGFAGSITTPVEEPLVESGRAGSILAIAGTSNGKHLIELWHGDSQEQVRLQQISWPERVQCLALTVDGGRMLAISHRYIGIWAVDSHGKIEQTQKIDLLMANQRELSCSTSEISPDNRNAIIGTNEGVLYALNLDSGRISRLALDSLGGIINDLEFDRDKQSLYVALWRNAPALLRLNLNAKPIAVTPLQGNDAARCLAISKNGEMLFVGDERGAVSAYSIRTHQIIWTERVSANSIVDIRPMSHGLFFGDEGGMVQMLKLETGIPLYLPTTASRSTITSLAAFQDEETVAIGGAGDPVRLWHTDFSHPLEQVLAIDHAGGLGITLSENGDHLTAYGDQTMISLHLTANGWNNNSGQSLFIPAGWRILSISPGGRLIALSAAYSNEAPDNLIRITTIKGELTTLSGFEAKLPQLAFSTSGRKLAAATFESRLQVALWDTDNLTGRPQILTSPDGRGATAITFSRDESLVAVNDLSGCVFVWQLPEGLNPLSLCDKSEKSGELAFDPSGKRLAAGSLKGRIRILYVSKDRLKEERVLDAHREPTTALEWDRSGRWLVSASNNGEISFWNTDLWQRVGSVRVPGDSFVRQIIPGPGDDRVVTLTQGGQRLSAWDLDPKRMAIRAAVLAKSVSD